MARNDEYMVYNENTDRYELTEQALLNNGINIRARYAEGNNSAGADEGIRALITDATNIVYNYAHDGVFDNAKQDYIINNDELVRKGIFRALLAEVISLARYGKRQDSVDDGERYVAIPHEVKAEFDMVYKHLGHTLKYAGRW